MDKILWIPITDMLMRADAFPVAATASRRLHTNTARYQANAAAETTKVLTRHERGRAARPSSPADRRPLSGKTIDISRFDTNFTRVRLRLDHPVAG
ncbi:hypothetical protein EVAR_23720_1 [Eumeta japonica]|uniref:Uncharacterized protein n=1 Tax=Eumeta variegata TaxID=151549 RepID=A0A4C1VH54_EUMVA|nr:hypothetical protein EVAR_23720_1 [Eumeta japonica]